MVITRAGERTRDAILHQAAQLATVEGLEGLSIGQLATATGMSKGGLYAHFGSKEELQLATVETARLIFVDDVMRPGLAAPRAAAGCWRCATRFSATSSGASSPGGCFFVAAGAEVGARPGPVRDAVAQQQRQWLDLLERLAREAQELGEVPTDVDPPQLAFELEAVLVAANSMFILFGDTGVFERARVAIRHRLGAAPGPPAPSLQNPGALRLAHVRRDRGRSALRRRVAGDAARSARASGGPRRSGGVPQRHAIHALPLAAWRRAVASMGRPRPTDCARL